MVKSNQSLTVSKFYALLFLTLLCLTRPALAQDTLGLAKRRADLRTRLTVHETTRQQKLAKLLRQRPNLPREFVDKKGVYHQLHDVDDLGGPLYIVTYSNDSLAKSIGTNKLRTGGSLGLNLQGQGMEVNANRARLGMWEPRELRTSHREFSGRATVRDGVPYVNGSYSGTALEALDHATHVAGTMMAEGVTARARGMAYQAKLDSYNADNDFIEMATAAQEGMLVSNHSYGPADPTTIAGRDSLGRYTQNSYLLDLIVYAAKNYLPFYAAGNSRETFFEPRKIYDLLGPYAVAKNVATVGAVYLLPNGYTGPASVSMSTFSSWGPTDDGRIKPDFVAPGVQIYSAYSTANDAYAFSDGTSMASPGAAGSLFLLQQHYKNTRNGAFMRAATLKGLAIHTADEAGSNPGPDYSFGWGLLNLEKAIFVLNNTGNAHFMEEATLVNGTTYNKPFTSTGGPFKATICWTDVAGPIQSYTTVADDRTPRLVNDLDLRIINASTNATIATLPWKLNPASPASAATRGDNVVDNVEQIVVDNLPAGNYVLRVTHKGTLAGDPLSDGPVAQQQEFSIFSTSTPVSALSLTASANPTTILTTGTTTLSATVSGGLPGYTYSFSGPGTITPGGNMATVSGLAAGVQTFTVVARDATSPASQSISQTVSVTVNSVPAELTLLSLTVTASPTTILTTGTTTLSVTASGGTAPYTYSFSGPGTIVRTGNTATVSGLPVGVQFFSVLVQDAGTAPNQQVGQVVSVTVNAVPTIPPTPVALVARVVTYNCSTGDLVVGSTGGNGSAVEYGIPGIGNFTSSTNFNIPVGVRRDASTVTIMVRQGGVMGTPLTFDFRNFCGGPPAPTPTPTPTPIPTPTPTSPLAATVVSYNCATGNLVLGVVGGNGSAVTYSIPGITAPTTNVNQNIPVGVRRDASTITISVQQGGVSGTPFTFNFRSFCQSQGAREGVSVEPVSELTITVLGNPASGEAVVEITGAEGQALGLRLADMSGRLLENRQVPVAGAIERQRFDLSRQPTGMILLQVSRAGQLKTVKIIKQ